MSESRVRLAQAWQARVGEFAQRPDMRALGDRLRAEEAARKRIYPPGPPTLAALEATPYEQVKVVVLGQGPYHGPGQAHGLSFSVPPGVEVPSSLANIFKEQERDLGLPRPDHGCLLP